MANTTLNPADKNTGITLSGGNLIATNNNNAQPQGVRAVDGQSTGKFYWECTINTTTNVVTAVGIVKSSTALNLQMNNAIAGSGQCVVTPYTNCTIYYDGGTFAQLGVGAIVSGSVVCIALDYSGRLIWFRSGAGGNWNGSGTANPATGVGGVSIASSFGGAAAYPFVQVSNTNDQVTANFGDTSFAGVVPAGFTSGWPLSPPSAAQVTQAAVEQWASTGTITGQALVTQVALEQWVPAVTVSNVDLAGNLGGSSHYGRFHYGLTKYSRVSAVAPAFSADLTLVPVVNLAGGLNPTIVLAADLDVHVNLIALSGAIAPQIAFGGALSLDLPLTALAGSFGFTIVYGAAEMISGPLWADSEPCPVPPWMASGPCEPVVWNKSRLCSG